MSTSVVRELIEMLEGSSLTDLYYELGELKITLKKKIRPAKGALTVTTAADTALNVTGQSDIISLKDESIVRSPIVGTVYLTKEPGAPEYVSVGQKVQKGDVLCLIEAMKMFSEITAPFSGTVSEIFMGSGDLAEFDAPLFRIEA